VGVKIRSGSTTSQSYINNLFLCDGRANFETPSLLLAESIRSALGGYPDIVAYTPNSKLGAINDVTRKMMEILNVGIRGFDDQLVKWSPKYPHGNKILASRERRETELSVFLDTDVVCLGPPDFSVITQNTPLFATPEGVPTWGRDEQDWVPVYEMFGLEIPDWRVRLIKVDVALSYRILMPEWWVLLKREILLGCGSLMSGFTRQQKLMPIRLSAAKGLGSIRYHCLWQRPGWAGEWKCYPNFIISHPIG